MTVITVLSVAGKSSVILVLFVVDVAGVMCRLNQYGLGGSFTVDSAFSIPKIKEPLSRLLVL